MRHLQQWKNLQGMNEINILFTGVGRRVELVQAFREAALVLDKCIKIYGADSSLTAPALAFCDYSRQVCGMKEEGYIGELLEICRKDKINLLVPTIDTDLLVLAQNREKFERVGTKVLVSSPEMVRVCRDKNLTSRFFTECGLKAPMPVNDWQEYQGGYPAFIKPKDGSSSINAYKVENPKELEEYASRIADYIVQPFIDGTEYTVDMFCDFDGNPVFITPRIRLAVRAGEVLKTQICLDERIISECEKLAARFRPCGPLAVQLIRDEKTGEDYYIEINPRFGGGAPLSMRAGAKSAQALFKLLCGEKSETGRLAGDGIIYSRFDQSVCIKEGKTTVRGVVFDLDDTLYPEKDYVKSGYRAVAQFLGEPEIADRLWNYFENGKMAIDEYLKEAGKPEFKDRCLEIYRNHQPEVRLYDGVEKMISSLKERGIRVGIITDGRPEGQRNKIKALGLEKLVSDIIITDELGGVQFRKPCDIAFRIMARRWRLPYEEMLYAGDNANKDFHAPGQLGMQCVWFKNSDGLYQSSREGVAFCINDINEVAGLI